MPTDEMIYAVLDYVRQAADFGTQVKVVHEEIPGTYTDSQIDGCLMYCEQRGYIDRQGTASGNVSFVKLRASGLDLLNSMDSSR